jgi:hypothetical protein
MLIGKIILCVVIGAGLAAIVISLYKAINGQPIMTPRRNKKALRRNRIIGVWIFLIFTTAMACFIFISQGINRKTIGAVCAVAIGTALYLLRGWVNMNLLRK